MTTVMTTSDFSERFESYIPKEEWKNIEFVSVHSKKLSLIERLSRGKIYLTKEYYLKILYKNTNKKYVSLPIQDKDPIKYGVTKFNFYLNNLAS